MKETDVDNWEGFQNEIEKLSQERVGNNRDTSLSPFLFRGQANHAWHLTTTLERYKIQEFSLKQYYDIISAAKPQIETFTGLQLNWSISTPPEYDEKIRTHGTLLPGESPEYEYMVYLRHHGFPSPLLDWTRSPHVAAYFAFREVTEETKKVSLFVYREYGDLVKTRSSDEPNITRRGPYIRSHRRHFLQQSEYTICAVQKEGLWNYVCHEKVFAHDNDDQDLLWKINIPAQERLKVLQLLDTYNLNSSSLFGTDETLETLALREFCFRDRQT